MLNHEVIRSKRKTISLEIRPDAALIVRSPNHVPLGYIKKLINRKKNWILAKQEQIKKRINRQQAMKGLFDKYTKKQAHKIISERVEFYSIRSGLKYEKIKITKARGRWGSCSGRGNLNFAHRLASAPIDIIDYVVVHELVHVEIRNHSKRFWKRVGELFPNYKQSKKWLRENGGLLL